jgi:peroxiredoxin
MRAVVVLLSALGTGFLLGSSPSPQKTPDSKPVEDFRLRDARGRWHCLDDLRKNKLVVIAFLGTECPLAARYAPRLAQLAKEFGPKGVTFLGIDANRQDSITAVAHFVKAHQLAFPVVKDVGNAVADRFGARRTPEVFVLDARRVVRYRGRIDDQFGIGYYRPKATHRDLAQALEELLAGKAVSRPVTEAAGCLIGRVPHKAAQGEVTYAKQIARILQRRCVSCHQPGAIAPFALTTYADAAGWADTIREVIDEGRMPPWHANPQYGKFANDARLTAEEKKLIDRWIDGGTPEGHRRDLPALSRLADGWRIGKPDLVVSIPKAFRVPATGTVRYQYFVVDPGLKEDKWIRASEARPGNRAVVHHVVVFALVPDASGQLRPEDVGKNFVAATGQGTPPMVYGPEEAKFLPKGCRLIFEVHYTPNGTPQTDRSRVGFVFADPRTVRRAIRSDAAVNERFRIPPGDPDHRVDVAYRFRQDTLLYSLLPHMHLRGKSFRYEAIYPDKRREVLLDVPRYSFDWQNFYVLARPKLMPEGTVLHCTAHFDNSAKNRSNPDPKAEVRFGLQTWDEMMVGYFDMALADQNLRLGAPRVTKRDDGRFDVLFRYKPSPAAKAVYLAGNFNDWKPTGHSMTGPDAKGAFSTGLTLKAGSYEYKYVLDGKTWKADPGNPLQKGYFNNSLLLVGDRTGIAKRSGGKPK